LSFLRSGYLFLLLDHLLHHMLVWAVLVITAALKESIIRRENSE
jgi:hypothetical protein